MNPTWKSLHEDCFVALASRNDSNTIYVKYMVRPPIVTILGHVDHGKTTLLDHIRQSRLAAKEHGGITQRIGAYEIEHGISGYHTDRMTFIDTPGHEAFSKLRSRGANVADIAILIIDAKDSVMPQTVESIAHIKATNIPFIVAINKTDLTGAKPDKVKQDLLKHEVVTEDKGGNIVAVPISAKEGTGVKELLESILLISADLKLTYEPENPAKAYVIETKRDKRGTVVSAIIKDGIIKNRQNLYAYQEEIKVKSLVSPTGTVMQEVKPSAAFELLGFTEPPEVGTLLTGEPVEKPKIANENEGKTPAESVHALLQQEADETKKLPVIIKADSQGSLEALQAALQKNDRIDIKLSAVGNVYRSDIFLAKTTKAIVVGFSIDTDNEVEELAKQEKVIIKTYNIIYELLEELEEVSDLLKEKEEAQKNKKAEAKVLATFIIENETVFGCEVLKGKVNIGDNAEIYRKDALINKAKVVSLKIRAKTVPEVKKGQECGMMFSPLVDIKVGDVIKFVL